ncbi:MAG: hypothetical protein JXQ75_11420 [Phycisphaerae bacterium]|nr:hypothetical protein [Phycisphaerae bacterium]
MTMGSRLLQAGISLIVGLVFAFASPYVEGERYAGLYVKSAAFADRLAALQKRLQCDDAQIASSVAISKEEFAKLKRGEMRVDMSLRNRFIEAYPAQEDALLGRMPSWTTASFWIWGFLGFLISATLLETFLQRLPGLDNTIRQKLELTLGELLGPAVYEGMRTSHVSLLDPGAKGIVDNIMASGTAGIVFAADRSEQDYAQLSIGLDKTCDSQFAFNLFSPETLVKDTRVAEHIAEVNARASRGLMAVVRVQVVTRENFAAFTSPGDRAVIDAYNTTYRNARGVTFLWVFSDDLGGAACPCEDYSVYSRRLVFTYNSSTRLLQLYVGGIVDTYLKVFGMDGTLRKDVAFDELLAGKIPLP